MTTTPFEDTDGAQHTSIAAEGAFFDALTATGRVTVTTLGVSPHQSHPIRLAEVALPTTPANAPVALFVGLQHGNEIASREAVLMMVRDLAETTDPALLSLLESRRICAIPSANPAALNSTRVVPGGGNVDMNRDHLALQAHETRILQQAITDLGPVMILDCHEQPQNPVIWEVQMANAGHAMADAGVGSLSADLTDVMRSALDAAGIAHSPYHHPNPNPGMLRNMASLRAISFTLVETPWSWPVLGEVPATLRAEWQRVAIGGALDWFASWGSVAQGVHDQVRAAETQAGADQEPLYFPGGVVLSPPPLGYRMPSPPPVNLDVYGIDYTESDGEVTVLAAQPLRTLIHIMFDPVSGDRIAEAEPIGPPPPSPPPAQPFRGRVKEVRAMVDGRWCDVTDMYVYNDYGFPVQVTLPTGG